MPLVLPHVHVDRRKRLITESRPEVLTTGDRALLLNVDWDLQRSTRSPGDRVLPLEHGRWAVGRGVPTGTLWRVVDMPDLAHLPHPAWLWTADAWFGSPLRESGPTPVPVPLKKALRQAARMTRSTRKTHRLVAAVVAHLRRPGRRPLAILAPEAQLASVPAARWFGLALVSCLPDEIALDLRIGTLEPAPDPRQWDLVLAHEAPEGFDVMEAERAPRVGEDLVAWYLRRRLLDGEPEQVEALTHLWLEGAEDPWEAGLAQALASGGPARIGLDKDTLVESPEVARKLVLARISGGARIDGRLANEIAAVTIKTSDASLWGALGARRESERRRVFRAWLASAHRYPPDDVLLQAVGTVRPAGAQSAEWLTALLRWFSTGHAPEAAALELQRALDEEAQAPDVASRASVWLELIIGLLESGRATAAVEAVDSPAARRLAAAGAARCVAQAWLLLPAASQTEVSLRDLLRLLGDAPDADKAALLLWTELRRRQRGRLAEAVLRCWARHLGNHPPTGRDALLENLRGTDSAALWVRLAALSASPETLRPLLLPVISRGQEALLLEAEAEWRRARSPAPRERFVALAAYLPEAAEAFEDRAREILGTLLATVAFPDPEVAEIASLLAEVGRSPLWMWLAVAASVPDQYDAPTIDATVHAFCGTPPRRPDEREMALVCARRLGAGRGWEPLDHARWIVRLTLAPDGDASGYNRTLALAMLKAILKRPDGLDRIVLMAHAILDLPPDHEALHLFIEDLLPRLWRNGPPEDFLDRVPVDRQPTEIKSAWRAAFGRW